MYKWLKYILTGFLSVPTLYGVWLLLRCLVFDYFTIPTSSMCPTLEPGDKVIVNKLLMGARIYSNLDFDLAGQELESWRTKGMRPLRHNDIVVFNFPHHEWRISFVINNVFCKRVVALPGDSLSIVDGHYRNNNFEGVLGLEEEQQRLENTPDSVLWQP
jgi:signal peptidase I